MRLKRIINKPTEKHADRTYAHNWVKECKEHLKVEIYPFGQKDVFNLTDSLIDLIYDYSEQIGEDSPFIFNYKNEYCKFAIKRFAKQFFITYFQKIIPGYIFSDTGKDEGLFCGFHDGRESDKEAASYNEILLGVGVNMQNGMSFDDALKYTIDTYKKTTRSLTSYDKIKNFVKNHLYNAQVLAKQLSTQMNLSKGYLAGKIYKQKYTQDFIKAGNYDNPNVTVEAKTDITLFNNINRYNLSIKYGKSSQIFSMVHNEFLGMINMCKCLTKQEKAEIKKLIIDHMYTFKGRMSDKSVNEKKPYSDMNILHTKLWAEICLKYPKLRNEILLQGITGECKFGKGSLGTADYIVCIDTDLLSLHVYTPQDFINTYLMHITDSFSAKNEKECFRARVN